MRQLTRVLSVILAALCLIVIVREYVDFDSFAWFSENRKTDADTEELQIKAEGLLIDHYNVYKYDYDTGEVWDLTKAPHANEENPDHFVMTPYDSIFPERNIKTPLIFEVAVYHMRPGTEAIDVYVDRIESVLQANGLPDFREPRYTSNLICVKAATEGMLGLDGSLHDSTAVFDPLTLAFKKLDASRFIETDANQELSSYTDRLSFDIQLSDSEKAKVASQTNESTDPIYIYFIVDYDMKLLDAHKISNFRDVNIFKNSNRANYANDLKTIIFEEKKD